MDDIEIDMKPTDEMRRGFIQPKVNGPKTVDTPELPDRPDRQYIPHIAWDVRLHRFLRSWILSTTDYQKEKRWPRITRIKFWLFGAQSSYYGLYERMRQMIRVITGGRVGMFVYTQRMEICFVKCNSLQIKVPRRGSKFKYFCGSCGCPKWWFSELRKKNRLRLWYCPEKHHPGPYPADAIRKRIANERELRLKDNNSGH